MTDTRILTSGQRAALQRAAAAALQLLPKIELLEALGNVSPQWAERAAELRVRRDLLARLAEAGLQFDESTAGMGGHGGTTHNPADRVPSAIPGVRRSG